MYLEEDLKKAFLAGIELVNKDWHKQEFCTTQCGCVELDYVDFESWLKNYKKKEL